MLKIAIVEDDPDQIAVMKVYCEKFAKERGIDYRFSEFDNPVDFMIKFNCNFDVVLLDIELPDMNGIEMARKLRRMDSNVVLVFVTNYSAFAVEGYEVDASDFIIKPVTYYEFSLKFEHALKKLSGGEDLRITVRYNDAVKYLSAADVYYVEVIKHKLVYHSAEGEFEIRGTLKKAEEELSGHGFAKCNNYCLINMHYVLGVDGFSLTLSTGIGKKSRTEIQISHPRKKEFMNALNRYLGENI